MMDMQSVPTRGEMAAVADQLEGFRVTNLLAPNSEYFIEIIGAQRSGEGCLPNELGLAAEDFSTLVDRHFPGIRNFPPPTQEACEKGDLRQQLLEMRREEWQDIRDLLLQHRRGADRSEIWMAEIVSAGCLGNNHLWRDLGLPSRESLRRLMAENFPELEVRNDRDMRWKKFLYKQLCEQEGHYLCRSPSCDTCPTYEECFGDES